MLFCLKLLSNLDVVDDSLELVFDWLINFVYHNEVDGYLKSFDCMLFSELRTQNSGIIHKSGSYVSW